jgi:predicted component of type VI protein secretion system
MEAKLVVVRGKASKGHISLKLPTIIGRSREADLTIAHPTISRKHCELYDQDGLLVIRDLGSMNGTFVGKKQVKRAELRPNQEFSIGPLTFRVLYEYDGKQSAANGKPSPEVDESSETQNEPDFTLLSDLSAETTDAPFAKLEELDEVQDGKSAQPVSARNNGGSNGDSDVLDFLLDNDPKPKKAGKDKGTSDDELDKFFKQLE